MNIAKNADVNATSIKVVEGLSTKGAVRMKPMMIGDQMTLLEIEYAPGAGAPLHAHQHETLCYVVEGSVRVVVAGEEFVLNVGDVCKHPEGVLHSIEGLEQAKVLEIKSPAQPIEQFLGTSN